MLPQSLPARRLALGVVLFAGLTGCAAPVATAAPPARVAVATPPTPRLVVYGDSLSVGANQERPVAAWPLQVAHALGDPSPATYGMPGFRAGEIAAAAASAGLRTGAAATALVVEAGTNDLVMSTPLAQFQSDYPALLAYAISTATTGAPRLVCLGVWHREQDANHLGATGADYDAVIRRACAARGGTYLALSGLYAATGDLSPVDGFHPSTQGQAAIAALVGRALIAG